MKMKQEAALSSTMAKYLGYSVYHAIFLLACVQALQSLGWHCIECVIHHEQNVHHELHPYICGANKQ